MDSGKLELPPQKKHARVTTNFGTGTNANNSLTAVFDKRGKRKQKKKKETHTQKEICQVIQAPLPNQTYTGSQLPTT